MRLRIAPFACVVFTAAWSLAASLSGEAKRAYDEGERALESGNVSAASSAFLRAQTLASDAPEPLVGRARTLLFGVAKVDASTKPRVTDAYKLLVSAQTKSSSFFPAFYEAGRVAYMIGDDKSAVQNLDRAVALDATHAEAVSLRAMAKLDSGNVGDSLADFKKAADLQPKNPVRFRNYGMALMANKQYSDAITAFQSAVAIDSSSVNVHLELGGAYLEDRQLSKAEGEFRTAITLDSKSAAAHDWLGLALQAQKKYADAEDQFRQAITLHETGDSWVNLGIAQLQQKRRSDAKSSFQKALVVDPKNDRAKDYLDWLDQHP